MKNKFLISIILVSCLGSTAFGSLSKGRSYGVHDDTGYYLGLGAGLGVTNWGKLGDSLSNDTGFVGRVFFGNDFTKNFALEGGYTYFGNTPSLNGKKYITKTMAFDILGKAKLPVLDNINVYSKFGANYLISFCTSDHNSGNRIGNLNVAFGIGAECEITSNIVAHVEWMRFNGKINTDKDDSYQPYADAYMVGIKYRLAI